MRDNGRAHRSKEGKIALDRKANNKTGREEASEYHYLRIRLRDIVIIIIISLYMRLQSLSLMKNYKNALTIRNC